jgi:general secretion pathway protein E
METAVDDLYLNYATPERALAFWREAGDRAGPELAEAARALGLEPVALDAAVLADPDLLQKTPEHFATANLLLPLDRDPDGAARVACATPFTGGAALELSEALGAPVRLLLARADLLATAIARAFSGEGVSQALSEMDGQGFAELESLEDLKDLAQAAPVIKLVNNLFMEAIGRKASDIHVSPYEGGLEVRYRVDGILAVASTVPRKFQPAILSRIKIMANLDIAEHRVPQDGRIRLKVESRDYDIRVAVTPTLFGEGAVMRILDKTSILVAIEDTGFEPDMLAAWLSLVQRPNGVILVTGPTGSGKTTTLYASLNHVKSPEIKIITIEDPVEYQLSGVDQIQVNAKAGLTFASALRSILRQDPDVIMVGEIRDSETAEIAMQSSLTGHLVLSTLHTNDAPAAVTRLLDMGIEPYLTASTLAGAMAQRLVRKLCPACRLQGPDGKWRPGGCPDCAGSGFRGRMGIFELLVVDEEVRRLIMARADTTQLAEAGRRQGMKSLLADGLAKAARGLTTEEEVRRVAGE